MPERLVGFLRWCHRLILQAVTMAQRLDEVPPSNPRLPEETRAAVCDIAERALALARAEHGLLRRAPIPRRSTAQQVETLFEKLVSYPEAERRLLIQGSQAYRDPLLCLRLCRASEDAAPVDPSEALELAELALFVAQHVGLEEPGSSARRTRLEGWCTGFIANAGRVIGSDLPGVERTWARTWRLWKAGEDPEGLLSEAYLLDMEASLRRDQRRFPQALRLHDDALALARPEEIGVILLNKSATLDQQGDYEASARALAKAARYIDGDRQPRHRFGQCFNEAANLLRLGRAVEALPVVEEVRGLAERLRNEIDLIRTLWLEANCAAGLSQREEALVKLEQVRHEFEARKLPFDYALASLDVALLYREEGRFPEIRALAAEMLEIFKAQQVHLEALRAVILFQEAAENEQVTVDLVRRLQSYFSKASKKPGLEFE